ncbi:hypothetical protein [Pseudomonas antarctica]|uniref:hypothetical protein n=1 Tax=Pseudomonas antarctica TaxID=219572 RepID=UPI00345D4B4B
MPEIKERPILFSAPMVRAILEGRKTVTRRAVKAQPSSKADIGSFGVGQPFIRNPDVTKPNPECPYGRPGDRLWVRETFGLQVRNYGGGTGEHIVYRATNPDAIYCKSAEGQEYPIKWKPSIHMPRHSSRILLEITVVRVEQLQDITEEQAKAEGVRLYTDHAELGDWWHVEGIETYSADPRKSFELLWSSVGGDWQANPWVWVVEFKRVTP